MSKQEHPYAQVLRWIADGEQIEWRHTFGIWEAINADVLLTALAGPHTVGVDRFRLKPRTININGHEVPEPMRVAPAVEDSYYVPDINDPASPSLGFLWGDTLFDRYRLDSRLCHATREAAEAHARALLSFTTTEAA